jgi:hypothetical protein
MNHLKDNPTLQALQASAATDRQDTAGQIAVKVDVVLSRKIEAARKRRAYHWDKALGRRVDGAVIRPIPPTGGRFVYRQPAIDPLEQNRIRHQLVRTVQVDD